MKISKATLKDQEVVFDLLIELKRSGYKEMGASFSGIKVTEDASNLFKKCLKRDDVYILLAEVEDNIIGLLVAYETPKIIEGRNRLVVEEMVIEPSYRGKGVGSELLKHIEDIARKKNIKHIKITTGTELKANEFYKKHGYKHFENAYRKDVSTN